MKSDVKHRGKKACISMPKNSGFFRRKLFRIGGIRRARKLFNVLAVGIRLIASMRRSNMSDRIAAEYEPETRVLKRAVAAAPAAATKHHSTTATRSCDGSRKEQW
jgi:hypothetical protein